MNRVGQGKAWYIASRNDLSFHRDFYGALIKQLGLPRALASELPPGVVVQRRTDGEQAFLFVQNFTAQTQKLSLPAGLSDLVDGMSVGGSLTLGAWGCRVLSRPMAQGAV